MGKICKSREDWHWEGAFSGVTAVAKLEGGFNCIQKEIGVRNIELSRVRPHRERQQNQAGGDVVCTGESCKSFGARSESHGW